MKNEDFSQRAIVNKETQIKTTKKLDLLDTTLGVDVIYGTFEISINYLHTEEILH